MSKLIWPLVMVGFWMRKPLSGEPAGPITSTRVRRSSSPCRRSLSLKSSSSRMRPIWARALMKCLGKWVANRDRSTVAMDNLPSGFNHNRRYQTERHVLIHLGPQAVEPDGIEQAAERPDLGTVGRPGEQARRGAL